MAVKLSDPGENKNDDKENPGLVFKFNIGKINQMFHQHHYKNHDDGNFPRQSEIKYRHEKNCNNTCNTDATEILNTKMWGWNEGNKS